MEKIGPVQGAPHQGPASHPIFPPMTLLIDRDYVTRALADLVRINSVNPALEPGGPGEEI